MSVQPGRQREPQPVSAPFNPELLLAEHKMLVNMARSNFFAYRKVIDPGLIEAPFVRSVSSHLQQFYLDYKAGRRPKLVLMAPPQHGKSRAAEDFIAYCAGRDPNLKTVYASFSDELGIQRNLTTQRTLTGPTYQSVFPGTRCNIFGWVTNSTLIEYAGHKGSFRNVTVNGTINGFGLDLGVIDDPVKGRAEAMSPTIRERTWAWFTDDFLGRFSKNSAMLIIMTRWHVDDIIGRYIAKNPDVKVLRYPAIGWQRPGEALFEEFKPLAFLEERQRTLTQAGWESEYQQNPIIVGGGIFPVDKLTVIPVFDPSMVKKSCRYVDKAGSETGRGARTAMVLMHWLKDGRFVISNVVKGRWNALDRENTLKMVAYQDQALYGRFGAYEVAVEQEPGSGGKESAEATVRNLPGLRVVLDKVSGSKEVRAEPFAAQVQGNNVRLVAGTWIDEFLDEMEGFPTAPLKDQVDAASGAFNRLTQGPVYNIDAMI